MVEHETPERLVCGAQAYPEASFMWSYRDQIIATHNVLYFGGPVARDQAGRYTCQAANRHGTGTVTAVLDVLYRPECRIQQEKGDDVVVLRCTADSNPAAVSFVWRRDNETWEGAVETGTAEGGAAETVIRVAVSQENLGTYHCYVNNTVGLGVPCEIDIQGIGVLKNISDTNIIVIVAVITAVLVAAAIVGVLVFLCRRKPAAEKCAKNEAESDVTAVSAVTSSTAPPVHKWPLRPGVHVHVNGLNTLTGTSAKLNHQINGFSYGAKTSRSSSSSGSDWASNASSNQELNSDSDPKKAGRSNISGAAPAPGSEQGSRPSSRQKKKRDINKNMADTLLPTFYENVSCHQKQRLQESLRRSESPAERLARLESPDRHGRLEGLDPGGLRPRSQQSNPGLYGFGSTRSSRRSRQSPSPCGGLHLGPPPPGGTSRLSAGPLLHGGSRFSTLHAPGYTKPLDLAEAEVESDSELPSALPSALPQERNLLIEYATHVPYRYSHDTPILSSLASQSLARSRHLEPDQTSLYSGPLLSEPISPPKQFDSSPQPRKAGRDGY